MIEYRYESDILRMVCCVFFFIWVMDAIYNTVDTSTRCEYWQICPVKMVIIEHEAPNVVKMTPKMGAMDVARRPSQLTSANGFSLGKRDRDETNSFTK